MLDSYFVFYRKTKDGKYYLKYYKNKDDLEPLATIPLARVVRVSGSVSSFHISIQRW